MMMAGDDVVDVVRAFAMPAKTDVCVDVGASEVLVMGRMARSLDEQRYLYTVEALSEGDIR
jgi:hypothetical protein